LETVDASIKTLDAYAKLGWLRKQKVSKRECKTIDETKLGDGYKHMYWVRGTQGNIADTQFSAELR
jgi:hypothetical protein